MSIGRTSCKRQAEAVTEQRRLVLVFGKAHGTGGILAGAVRINSLVISVPKNMRSFFSGVIFDELVAVPAAVIEGGVGTDKRAIGLSVALESQEIIAFVLHP